VQTASRKFCGGPISQKATSVLPSVHNFIAVSSAVFSKLNEFLPPGIAKNSLRELRGAENFAVKKREGNDVNSLFVSVSIVSYALYEGECT
jgi:hypothetical protein